MEEKRIIYVNSRNRISGTNSDFLFKIDIKDIEPTLVCCLQANIPKSYYLIREGENTFTLSEGVQSETITLTVGNYSRKALSTAVALALNTASALMSTYTYTMTYAKSSTSVDNGKYTYAVTGNGGTQPVLTFNSTDNIYEVLGFDIGSVNPFVGDELTSTNVVKLQIEDSIFIHSDICSNGSDNVLQEIFANNDPDFSNIVFQTPDVTAYSKKLTTSSNNMVRFYLTNEDNELLDLNGLNWTCTLLFYKPERKLLKFARDYVKILHS